MNKMRNYLLVCLLLLFNPAAGAAQSTAPTSPRTSQRITWTPTWAASPQSPSPDQKDPLLKIENQTVRERVRVSLGGTQICLRLSNEHGTAPLLIGAVTVAAPTEPASVKSDSIKAVTFGGLKTVAIPAGAPLFSDPVAFPVDSGAEISVSIYFPKRVSSPTLHALALKRAVISQRGDHSGEEKIEAAAMSEGSISISAVLVPSQSARRLVVAFGDSITDGDGSTLDADHNWPGYLIRRLAKSPESSKVALVNSGIAGNRLLSDGYGISALARFDRDALALPGVTHIVLLEGLNDIGFPGARLNGRYLAEPGEARTAEDLIYAYRQLISRAHARGVKLIGATITPFEGTTISGYYSDAKETVRQAVNKWIRSSGSFDAVIDFDAVLRDPAQPSRLLPQFSSPDHLHPSDLGYQAMAAALDLALFK